MADRFDVGSARNVVLGIGKVSRAPFGSSPERPAVGSMAGFPQVRERLKVERELLRLSGDDGRDTAPPRGSSAEKMRAGAEAVRRPTRRAPRFWVRTHLLLCGPTRRRAEGARRRIFLAE